MNSTPSNWKEARRLQAWHLKQQGWSQRQIATAMGVSEGAVSQWMTRAREGGLEALRHRPPPGAPRRLSAEQLAQLPELLHRGPEAYGFRGQLWTRGRIAAVIRVAFGISYHPVHVGRLLKAIQWSPQKPARRARQRDEAAIAHWREQTWPALKANGAAHRLYVERLPAYAPDLNPGEGLWQQLKGVELRNMCCVDIPHLRGELRDAVKRVRRKPRILKGCFQGAGL
jgi:transposase